jgi:hypothetical protein
MFSRSMREALEAKTIADRIQPRGAAPTAPRPTGDRPCPGCGRLTSQLEADERGGLAGPLYEHRIHDDHVWPQLHSCEPAPDDCPFCKDCLDC